MYVCVNVMYARGLRLLPPSVPFPKVAQDSPPPPTFTVPAFRARKHRGGESDLLKDTYPSGFCKPPKNRPLPTTTKTSSTASTRRKPLSSSGPQLRDLLFESKEIGLLPCGAAAGRQALNVTRVVVGANDVVDTIGSELVQFAGFSIGPAELSSPTSIINKSHHDPRPRTPSPVSPSRMTIDGSALLIMKRSSLLVEARSVANQWFGLKSNAPGDFFASPRDESNAWKGRKRIRSATTDRAQSPGEPEPWPYSGRSSRPSTSASTKRGPGGAVAVVLRVDVGGDIEQPCGLSMDGKEDSARPVHRDNATKHGHAGTHDQSIQSPTATANEADPRGLLGAEENSCSTQEERQAGCRNEMIEREKEREPALLSEDERNGRGRIDRASAKDCPSVVSEGDGSSSCFVASVSTSGNDTSGAGKRSFSTLDTERYRGNLSKDATKILRSHLESRNKPLSNTTSCVSDAVATEDTGLISPAPPPTPSGQARVAEFKQTVMHMYSKQPHPLSLSHVLVMHSSTETFLQLTLTSAYPESPVLPFPISSSALHDGIHLPNKAAYERPARRTPTKHYGSAVLSSPRGPFARDVLREDKR